jgi:PHD/YefM family antitoxin component YafN of YafNO toxin-antitoxin module
MSEQAVHGPHKSEWITISIDEYESMQRTIEVLSDPDLMTQLDEGKRKNTPTREFEELAGELGI